MRFRPYLGHGHDRHVHVASKPKPFAVDLFAIAVLPHLYQQSNVALVFACDSSKMPVVSLLSVEVSTTILFMQTEKSLDCAVTAMCSNNMEEELLHTLDQVSVSAVMK